MTPSTKRTILVVDDESIIRTTVSLVMRRAGYETSIAKDGFEALRHLRTSIPDVVISDLNMPHMSGFEFLSVLRRRFPEIVVLARSGAYQFAESVPGGVIADAFLGKGQHGPEKMLKAVAELIDNKTAYVENHRNHPAPMWIPRNGKDASGVPYIVVTCTECLRSFPLTVTKDEPHEIHETACLFCSTAVRYIIDFSRDVSSPPVKHPRHATIQSRPLAGNGESHD